MQWFIDRLKQRHSKFLSDVVLIYQYEFYIEVDYIFKSIVYK